MNCNYIKNITLLTFLISEILGVPFLSQSDLFAAAFISRADFPLFAPCFFPAMRHSVDACH